MHTIKNIDVVIAFTAMDGGQVTNMSHALSVFKTAKRNIHNHLSIPSDFD